MMASAASTGNEEEEEEEAQLREMMRCANDQRSTVVAGERRAGGDYVAAKQADARATKGDVPAPATTVARKASGLDLQLVAITVGLLLCVSAVLYQVVFL
jgi:hypothetical protein